MEEKTLKPCPFCGGEAEVKVGRSCMNKTYAVVCKDKTCQGRAHKSFFVEYGAIKSWNRRVNNG